MVFPSETSKILFCVNGNEFFGVCQNQNFYIGNQSDNNNVNLVEPEKKALNTSRWKGLKIKIQRIIFIFLTDQRSQNFTGI